MSYGIMNIGAGMAQGQQLARQDRIDEEYRGMDRQREQRSQERHDATMDANKSNQDWSSRLRERTVDQWKTADQEKQVQSQLNQALAQYAVGGDPSGLFAIHEQVLGSKPVMGEDGTVRVQKPNGEVEEIPIQEYLNQAAAMTQPGGFIKMMEQRQAAMAAEQAAATEHGRARELEGVKGGEFVRGPDGNLVWADAGETPTAPDGRPIPAAGNQTGSEQTAKMQEARDIASAFGISLDQAYTILLRPKGRSAQESIADIAKVLMESSGIQSEYRTDPNTAYEKASDIYQSLPKGDFGIQPGGAGGGGGGAGGGAGAKPGSSPQNPVDADSLTANPPANTYVTMEGTVYLFDGNQLVPVQ